MTRLIRLLSFLAFSLGAPLALNAQQGEAQTAIVRGRLLLSSAGNGAIATEVQVSIPELKRLTATDGDGGFLFSQVPYGEYNLVFGGSTIQTDTVRIVVGAPLVELKDMPVRAAEGGTSMQSLQIPTLGLEENDVAGGDDDGTRSQNVSGLLTASRDPFLSTTAFVFGPYRFLPRGYDRSTQQVLINGAPMNDVETGDAFWNQWGGLNDVFRSRSQAYGLQPNEYAFGGPLGTTYFDATAASQRAQTRLTYSISNRQYRNRLMLTHSTGMQANGWAYSVSLSKRWAEQGYVKGTYYDGYSYYLGVSRKIRNNTINLTVFGAPTSRGKIAPAIQEAYDLAGTNYYNPNWGYQNGEVRNAKVQQSHTPTALLNWERALSSRSRWNTTIGYQDGRVSNSTLDWFNADDPRPDYYRNFPSYFEGIDNQYTADVQRSKLGGNPELYMQINWDTLYEANLMNRRDIPGADGRPSGQTGLRSLYAVGADVDEIRKVIFNSNYENVLSDHFTFYGGVSVIGQGTESYREMLDLLGGEYWVNLNQFSLRNFATEAPLYQNDVNNPNGIIHVGDRYSYNYKNNFFKGWAWAQTTATYNKVDFFGSVNIGYNTFNREGLFRNGLFADGNESFGKSETQKFLTYGLKGGATYKVSGRHYLFLNGGLFADAPTVDNTFVSARTRNQVIAEPETMKTKTAEGGYLFRAPRVNIRAVGYATETTDGVEIKRFFNESGLSGGGQTFTNYVLSDIKARYMGTELAVDYKIHSTLSVTAVAAMGQAFYANRPKVAVYRDNDTNDFVSRRSTFIENYYLAVGPQSAYSLGFNYRSKKYWYVSLTGNYFDRNYVDVAADRRTNEATEDFARGSEEWHRVVDQERLPSAFTLDFFGGKSFLLSKFSKKIPRNTFLYLNVGVSNLLDNQDFRTGGFEQLRFDFDGSPGAFPAKYFYAYGRNFFVNASLKF